MPFAQWGYPHMGAERSTQQYPADFICEAIDQTRGWFYTLMAIGTLVFDESSYRNVVCLGHILDEDGRKMSKHLGNVLEPIPLMDEHGADAVRWFMLACRVAVAGPSGRPPGDRGGRPQDAADLLEHGVVPGAVCPGRGLGRRMTAVGRQRSRIGRHGSLGPVAGPPDGPVGRRGAGALRHPARLADYLAAFVEICPTGMCAVPGAGSGTAIRLHWQPCDEACGL